MTLPTVYELSFDFTSFQSASPTTPLPADRFEIEFNNIALTTDDIIRNLNIIQKSDGSLANGVVKVENLATELTIGLRSPVAWTNGATFVVNDTAIEDNILYRCIENHVSGVFVTDLANSKWLLIADYTAFSTDAESAKDDAEDAALAAQIAQTGAESAYDQFDDRYLGSKAGDPATDNDGGVLQTGAIYWNTTNNGMRVYTGSSWGDAIGGTSLPIFIFTATNGQTSITGADDNGTTLFYTVGKFQLFINGVLRTQDVTAVDGVSITGIPALNANDVVEVYSFQSIAVLEDISTHSVAAPLRTDCLLFEDKSDGGVDRKASIEDIVLADGIITQANSATPNLLDSFLFGDDSDSDKTKRATISQLIALVSGTPIGTINAYAGSAAPAEWLLCGGQAVSRTTYANLYAALGTTYGSGDGSTTFNLPDLRGRVLAGKDNMGGTSANRLTDQSGGVDGDGLGNVGGDETHTLASGEMPEHSHDAGNLTTNAAGAHTHSLDFGTGTLTQSVYHVRKSTATNSVTQSGMVGSAGNHTHTLTGETGNVGNGNAHNNVQPTIILNYIIKF